MMAEGVQECRHTLYRIGSRLQLLTSAYTSRLERTLLCSFHNGPDSTSVKDDGGISDGRGGTNCPGRSVGRMCQLLL